MSLAGASVPEDLRPSGIDPLTAAPRVQTRVEGFGYQARGPVTNERSRKVERPPQTPSWTFGTCSLPEPGKRPPSQAQASEEAARAQPPPTAGMRLSDFDYALPEERIAQHPLPVRDRARLFVHERATDRSHHSVVCQLSTFLRAGDLLVVNDTRVLRSRLFARRASGGRVEFLLLEPSPEAPHAWTALVHPARRLQLGQRLALEQTEYSLHLLSRARNADGSAGMEWSVQIEGAPGRPLDPVPILERAGHVPLPPYVARADDVQDGTGYQTVYARAPGAVAAPTAGLHFTAELLDELARAGVERAALTLHVGPGTFQPVKCESIAEHRMHAERFELPQDTVEAVRRVRARGGRVVAVGTTVVRVLESCVDARGDLVPQRGSTRLFLTPGARFRVVDALLTNFHLPRSTLLMLVCAFAGRERVLRLYGEAIEHGYRFYSYGDAMLLL